MGCTEPIAVAYAAALARETLGCLPTLVHISVSGNILKNVKSVIVPNTGNLRGVTSAAAAGIAVGDAKKQLEVLSSVTECDYPKIREYLSHTEFTVDEAQSGCIFDIGIEVRSECDRAFVRITGHHTNVIRIEKNGQVLLSKSDYGEAAAADADPLSIAAVYQFASEADLDDVRDVLERQISYNVAISDEGLRGDYGAKVGKTLLKAYGDSVHNRAKAAAAAGSDARMNGCALPVVIVSGSGNQGMTASLPVITYADHLKTDRDKLLRALIVSDLVTVHLKHEIGRLSAYCGAVSARLRSGGGNLLFIRRGLRRDLPYRRQRSCNRLGNRMRRRKVELRRKNRFRSGGGTARLRTLPQRQSVLRRRRHCGKGRGKHHSQRGRTCKQRNAGDRRGNYPSHD